MEKLIITAAICGAEVTKENNPAVPYTVEEIVREAESIFNAITSIKISLEYNSISLEIFFAG